MVNYIAKKLEDYTIRFPEKVLLVHIETNGEPETILVFKGFSSSLTGATAFDPDVPVFSQDAKILGIDILQSPYSPSNPMYLQRGITWEEMEQL